MVCQAEMYDSWTPPSRPRIVSGQLFYIKFPLEFRQCTLRILQIYAFSPSYCLKRQGKSCETKKHARKERTKAIYKLCHQKSFIISFWEVFLRNRHGVWGDKDEETSLKSKRRQFLADFEWNSSKPTGYVRGKFGELEWNAAHSFDEVDDVAVWQRKQFLIGLESFKCKARYMLPKAMFACWVNTEMFAKQTIFQIKFHKFLAFEGCLVINSSTEMKPFWSLFP